MDISKGFINRTYKKDGALNAQVATRQGKKPVDDVLLVFPTGFASNPKSNINGAMVLLFRSKALNFAMPYNPLLEPVLEDEEVAIGNFNNTNKIIFKDNGDIEISATSATLKEMVNKLEVEATTSTTEIAPSITKTAATNITMTAPTIALGAASGLLLNALASMQVVIPGGSSAGTYPVTIVSPGQTQVSA
jgi:hypothetical protein